MGSLSVDDIRKALGLRGKPNNYDRGAGWTTEMLLEALEDAGKGNLVNIICHDYSFCGFLKGIATDYAKQLKIDAKLLNFVPASTAYHQLIGLHPLNLYVDHYVYAQGMDKDYRINELEQYARSKPTVN